VAVAPSTSVIDYFRTEISLGRLSPGQRLPPEPELCEKLGVSRGALRESLRELQGYGLLEARHGSGTYVSSLKPAELLKGLAFTVDVVPLEGLLELLGVRRAVEAEAAASAAARASDEDIAQLEGLIEQMSAAQDIDTRQQLDEELHALICDLAGNESASTIASVIRSRARHYDLIDHDDARIEVDLGHAAIVRAIRSRNAMAAWAAMHAHVSATEVWLRNINPAPR